MKRSQPMTPMQILNDLLVRTGQGDQNAFAQLHERSSAKLLGITHRILNNTALAEEALQEAYVQIWQRAKTFDPSIASSIAWMAVIARNKAIDIRRLSAEKLSQQGTELDENLVSDTPSAFDATEQNQELKRLLLCLDQLAPEQREMVLRAYYRGETREELSTRYNRPVATVKSILRRGLMALRGCLDT